MLFVRGRDSARWTYRILLVLLMPSPCHKLRSAVGLAISICPGRSDGRQLAYQSKRTFHLAHGVACQKPIEGLIFQLLAAMILPVVLSVTLIQ
ncbi:hypothetical protein KVT40_004470 [Elsinoe batatas]|uniref:Uncharacterized protein n=1 Tax=Elsinoe batatas TaxID=2601811 RepID=A0A8K0L3S3_9PEZI|nr:hypothetical protein KVT40_004470 [Elsinoe batatas]